MIIYLVTQLFPKDPSSRFRLRRRWYISANNREDAIEQVKACVFHKDGDWFASIEGPVVCLPFDEVME